MANCLDSDEVAHDEPPHLDLYCLQIQLSSFSHFNPVAPRKAKIVYNFGLSECDSIKCKIDLLFKH